MDKEGIVFAIQRFSIHDGPGIRTLVFFKGCSLRCKWCSNPESQNFGQELFFHPEKCTGCLACIHACPRNAISRRENGQIDFHRERCQNCGNCALVCTTKARKMEGWKMTVPEVIEEIKRDEDFYSSSGGGVTLGGGDPLTRPEFAESILMECKKAGIHTAIETAGHVDWSAIEKVLPYTDLFLYDLKHMNPNTHKANIGVDNTLILSNLEKLAKATKNIIVRTPIIPGFNDQEIEIRKIAQFVSKLNISELNLLPYHQYGVEKYRYLGREYPFAEKEKLDDAKIENLKRIAGSENLKVQVGG